MRRVITSLVVFSAAILVTALFYAGKVGATPANGFTATTLAKGTFGEIDVFNHFLPPGSPPQKLWLSWQKTKGDSDLYVQNNTWQPGGSTGWHSHPGHSLIIVTAGTLTEYHGDDSDCKPIVYTQGMSFVDPGGSHVHIIRNEGNVVAQSIAVQLIPAGQPRRIDVAAPGNCPF